jgi:hypothetical protein
MRKEWILTDEEKRLKRRKIERNRLIKQQAQVAGHQHPNNDTIHSNIQSSSSTIEVCPEKEQQRIIRRVKTKIICWIIRNT